LITTTFPYTGTLRKIKDKYIIYTSNDTGVWTDDVLNAIWTPFTIPNPDNVTESIWNNAYLRADGNYFVLVRALGIYDSHYYWTTPDGINFTYFGENYLMTLLNDGGYDLGNQLSVISSPDRQRWVITVERNLSNNNGRGLSLIYSNDGAVTWQLQKNLFVSPDEPNQPARCFYDVNSDRIFIMGSYQYNNDSDNNEKYIIYEKSDYSGYRVKVDSSVMTGSISTSGSRALNRLTSSSNGNTYVSDSYGRYYYQVEFSGDDATITRISGSFGMDGTFPPALASPPDQPTDTNNALSEGIIQASSYITFSSLAAPFLTDQSLLELKIPSIGGQVAWKSGTGLTSLIGSSLFHIPDPFLDETILNRKTTFITDSTGVYRKAL
jgi:hypothetical protein